MARLLSILTAILLAYVPSAHARDDGGFGNGFTGNAPSALSGGNSAPSALAKDETVIDANTVADIQPAAGDEEPNPEIQNIPAHDEAFKPDADTFAPKNISQ